jgi:hypothetical protein
MSGLFSTPSLPPVPPPPPAPSGSGSVVQQAAANEKARAGVRQGRASTYLTDPGSQTTAQPNQQRYLGNK